VILRADFGWVILVAFVFWVLQMVRAGATGKSGRAGPHLPPPGNPGGTQREGVELEQLLRHLEGRLGKAGEQVGQVRPQVTVRRPVPTQPVPVTLRREPPGRLSIETAPVEGASLETEASLTAEGSLVQVRPRVQFSLPAPNDTPVQRATAATAVTARQLRDAVLWQEILGPPKGLQ
jgi:hypothetical protein